MFIVSEACGAFDGSSTSYIGMMWVSVSSEAIRGWCRNMLILDWAIYITGHLLTLSRDAKYSGVSL
jgi:hypothetical protein